MIGTVEQIRLKSNRPVRREMSRFEKKSEGAGPACASEKVPGAISAHQPLCMDTFHLDLILFPFFILP